MPKSTNRQAELRELLDQLNLGGMAAIFAEVALRAAKEHLTHEAYLWELAAHERDLRTQRRTARLLRASGLPTEKTFRSFDLGKLPRAAKCKPAIQPSVRASNVAICSAERSCPSSRFK